MRGMRPSSLEGTNWTFAHVLGDQRFWVRENLPPGFFDFLCSVNPSPSSHKLIARRFFEEAGLATADLYASGISLDQAMDVVSQTRRCFVKPEYGGGGNGTIGLVRRGTRFLNTLSGEARSLGNWRRYLAASQKLYRCKRWMVEELLVRRGTEASPPDEYKFFAFAGTIVHVDARRATWEGGASAKFRTFDSAWNPVDTGAYTGVYANSLDESIPPLRGREREDFTEAAQRMSRRRPIPFTRIDLYSTDRGIVGGELTIVTGGSSLFSNQWRDRLAEAWDEAAARMSEEIQRGDMDDIIEFYSHVMEETRPIWRPVMWRRRLQKLPGFLKRRLALVR